MKIYSKLDFFFGVSCTFALVLFILDIIHVEWWQYLITIAISSSFIYRGLNESANKHQQAVNAHYKETAVALYGQHYYIRTNLPWIMVIIFYPIALILRFAFRIWLPIWLHVLFVILLTIAAFYSIGINNNITKEIDEKINKDAL